MPNWCHNSMKITGTISEITRFKQTCIRTVSENKQAQLDFRASNLVGRATFIRTAARS